MPVASTYAGLSDDPADTRLVARVHPQGWTNPTPAGRYNLVVIGGGTAGLVSAMGAAGLGGKVALIERLLLGGDCLNFGCVPSKSFIAAAHAASAGGRDVGADTFSEAMRRVRAVRADIAVNDSAERLRSAGVDVFFGQARFAGPDTVVVGDQRLQFSRAVIASGARAALPPIPGLDTVRALTNETVFSLTERPARIAVIGGGPIGCELAQAFAGLGSAVRLFDLAPRLLGKDDADAAAILASALTRSGVELTLAASLTRFERAADGAPAGTSDGGGTLVFDRGQGSERHAFDAVLVAAGRRSNVEGLDLESAGVAFDKRGVSVNARLRTSNRRIYAAGDCCQVTNGASSGEAADPPKFQFTHVADAMARIVIQNALFFGRKSSLDLVIPWATYTSPEVAHVGLGQDEIAARRDALTTVTVPLSDNDRAVCEGDTEGFGRFHVDRKGRILAATIVGAHAGELIGEVTLAMTNGITMGQIAGTIHPYPTRSEVIKRAADQLNRGRLTPFVAGVLRRILKWRR